MFDPVSYTVTEGGQSPMVCVTIMGVPSGGTEADVVVTLISVDGIKTGIVLVTVFEASPDLHIMALYDMSLAAFVKSVSIVAGTYR